MAFVIKFNLKAALTEFYLLTGLSLGEKLIKNWYRQQDSPH